MRTVVGAVICLVAIVTATPATASRLQVVYPTGTIDGSCTLIHLEPGDRRTTLYFITSAQPFRTARGEAFRTPESVLITLDDDEVVAVPREGIVLPLGSLVDIALLRVDVAIPPAAPSLISFETPSVGSKFEIIGRDRDGLAASVPQHTRFVSTRFVVGDRDVASLAGCLGAPASMNGSLFGIVSACEPHNAPLITLLAPAYPFLERHVPTASARPTLR